MSDASTTATGTEPLPTQTADGTLVDHSVASPPSTTQETSPGTTLLTEPAKEPTAEAKPDDKAAKPGAPEKYEDYTVPEGWSLDPETKTAADAIFKDLGLSQEQAQRLVDFYAKEASEAFEAPMNAWRDMNDKWRKDAEAHPDLRGKLGAGQEINTRISKALDAVGDPALVTEFKQLMDLTGAGNHPAFIRVINHWAKQVTEGTAVEGRGPSPGGQSAPGARPPSTAKAMYPHLPSTS